MAGEARPMSLAATIRMASIADRERLLEMGRKFLAEGPYRQHLKDNPERAGKLISTLLESEAARVLVYEENGTVEGVLCFILFDHYFSGEMTAGELIWYVEPEFRGKASLELLWAAEKMAYESGATHMQLTSPDEHAGKIYERIKYAPVETTYQARLEARVKH